MTAPNEQRLKDVAFYYPGPMWHSARHIKSLLLFFDGIALLVPSYMRDKPFDMEPEMAHPLQEAGLLHIFEPESVVDRTATEQLATALTDIIVSGALDPLAREATAFHELSWSRLGGYGDEGLARMIHEELKQRKLARESADGVSIPMHPMVRSLVLVLLSQILRSQGRHLGMDLSPVTDRPEWVGALTEILNVETAPSAGQVVSLDLQAVGVDLGEVPLDEVLSFRKDHLGAYRKYAADVRRAVRDVSLLPKHQRADELGLRANEIRQAGEVLAQLSTKAWKRRAAFGMAAAGAAWTASSGNPVGAALSIGGAILGFQSTPKETGAFTYLFKARDGM